MKNFLVKFLVAVAVFAGMLWWGIQKQQLDSSTLAERAAQRFSPSK